MALNCGNCEVVHLDAFVELQLKTTFSPGLAAFGVNDAAVVVAGTVTVIDLVALLLQTGGPPRLRKSLSYISKFR